MEFLHASLHPGESIRSPRILQVLWEGGDLDWGQNQFRRTMLAHIVPQRDGKPVEAGRKASYETLLHMQVYRRHADAGAVLHTHSTANTVLSRRFERIVLSNYELLKVLPGAPDPQSHVAIPVFANDQDIARLSAAVDAHMVREPATPAYLIAGHGLYAWGGTVAQARHRVEAIEFMLECHLRELSL